MKTAILLNGNVRTIDQCKNSILSCFKHLNPDYYACTYFNQFGYHPFVKGSIGYHEDPVLSEKEINDKFIDFNLKSILIEDIFEINSFYKAEENKFHPNMKGLESSFLQYAKFKKGLELINKFEIEHNIQYDIIIKTRCDLFHSDIVKQISLNDLAQKLIISSGNVFPNDCILISSKNNIFKIIDFMIEEFYKYTNANSNQMAPHGLLLAAAQSIPLSIDSYKIMEYVVRANQIQYY